MAAEQYKIDPSHWLYNRHRKVSHFVKQPHHCKKEISEEVLHKREWRKKKGFSKDQSKTKTWKRLAGVYYKKLSNNMHRSWGKRNDGQWEI